MKFFLSNRIGILSSGAVTLVISLFVSTQLSAQCKSVIKIDGKRSVVDQSLATAIMLPYWLASGQTLALGYGVQSVSIIEFSVNGTSLEFSNVLNFTSVTPVSVPENKVWKMESVSMINNINNYNSIKYTLSGNYTFTVPSCAEEICVEAWGGGGAGGGSGAVANNGGSGGGGGGYGAECFSVTPGASYPVVIGAGGVGTNGTGGTGQTTSLVGLISASGGTGGGAGSGSSVGTGGSSSAAAFAIGGSGTQGNALISGRGGAAGNGGIGAAGLNTNTPGNFATNFSSGGSGAYTTTTTQKAGGAGADGQLIITW